MNRSAARVQSPRSELADSQRQLIDDLAQSDECVNEATESKAALQIHCRRLTDRLSQLSARERSAMECVLCRHMTFMIVAFAEEAIRRDRGGTTLVVG